MLQDKTQQTDRLFLLFIFILAIFGLIILASASSPVGYARFGDIYYFIKRQLLFGFLPGVILLFITTRVNPQFFKRMAWPIYFLSLAGLVAVFIPGLGRVINGSRSWLNLFGYSFQPSELVKLALIIVFAKLLVDKKKFNDWKIDLLPLLTIIFPALLLVALQPDIGTLTVLAVIIFCMLYAAGIEKKYLFVLGCLGVLAVGILILVAPNRMQRVTTFLHPELDPQGKGYQINQAYLAVGSGGILGAGLGNSRQKFQYLPEVQADSIFAIMAEEIGYIFSAAFIIFTLIIFLRGLKIANNAQDEFGRLLVVGIMVWFIWQTFLNIGAIIGLLPLTGVPLPFVSHGGSALLLMFAAMGMVVGVSRGIYNH